MTTLSIVSPAHNEAANLPSFYHRIKSVMDEAGMEWNLVVVDDQSTDDTFEVLTRLAAEDARITAVRLARNAGSHKAILCGLEYAEGDCVTIMASDLEDPPEQIPMLVEKWRAGARVVWAARQDRHNVGFVYRMLARLYYVFSRRVIGLKNLPETGADFLLLDQATAQIVRQYRDKSLSLFALIAWLDQPSAVVTYHKETRRHGHSSWTLGSRVKLVIDTLVSFSYLPIRIMTMIGFITSMAGFGFALNVLWNAF
jgi:glycosyltransferase involved in cell wall biosynthesis